MSCVGRILEGDLESGVEWSDWTVEWSDWTVPGLCLACAWISLDFNGFRLDFVGFRWILLEFKKGTPNDPQPNYIARGDGS